ncbi:MAG: histidinol dehydrogenase [Candidatus Omnitrophica bacterium]|nr:histidinol dehydrogenase [Candidatus Omnitrophota bacterium]
MQVLTWDKNLLRRLPQVKRVSFDRDLFQKVHRILSEVREKGDAALNRFTKEFDGVDVSAQRLRVTEANVNAAFEKIDTDFVPILKHISEGAERYYQKDLPKSFRIKEKDGVTLAKQYRPLERVGVYVPGGTAPLVSTVYMTVIPARAAGVKEIVITSPPNRDTGDIDPHILIVANLLGVKEIYRVGGAQAIGALAFGTKTIRRVDKIVGPGNQYVAEAKRQVYGFVDIDMFAGPSEVAILADQSSDINYITCDLLAQGEHFGGQIYLVTDSKKIVEQMRRRVEMGIIIHVNNLEEGCNAINEIAPEHLQIMTKKAERWVSRIEHAGAIFLGPYSPAVVGDYVAGPSHVLPTGGTARFFSPLSSSDFVKSSQVIRFSRESLEKSRQFVQKLTQVEGLVLHRISMEARFLRSSQVSKE